MRILVTGGAGYIGSHTCKALAVAGHDPIVLDDLRNGHRWAVRWGPLAEVSLSNRDGLIETFRAYRPEAVIHFAASAYVAESMYAPAEYFHNNVVNTLNLLDAMRTTEVGSIVFSSTCAVYGNPACVPLHEGLPPHPESPYGESKLMVERALEWYGRAYGLSWTALRYFNAAGADLEGELGEVHNPETHLIPLAISAALEDGPELQVFGTDYDTPDGTAIRDFIHVNDLASAHVKAVEHFGEKHSSGAINLGAGSGHSVREVIAAVERICQRRVPCRNRPRRPGDPPVLIADPSRALAELSWTPRCSSLDEMVDTAVRWHVSYQQGIVGRVAVAAV